MSIELEVKSNSKQAQTDLRTLNRSVDKITATTENATKTLQRLAIGATALFATIGVTKSITGVTDSYRRLEARISLTNNSLLKQEFAFRQINKIALETRSSQEGLADLYSRIGRATKILGVEQKTVISVTRSIAKAITISGASAESANSAIVQLGQGLAAGALRGQELNSVMEQTPAVAQAIARGLNITLGELRQYANEGKLTAAAVVKALKGQADEIDKEFARVPVTFAQGLTVLSTGFGRLVNELDFVAGVTGRSTRNLVRLGTTLNSVARPLANSLDTAITSISNFGASLAPINLAIGSVINSLANLGKSTSEAFGFGSLVNQLGGIENLFASIKRAINNIIPSVQTVAFALQIAANGINAFAKNISRALAPIRDFTNKVAGFFYDLYIEVVGNSTWPDLIDGVIAYSGKIIDALKPIQNFAAAVATEFSTLFEQFNKTVTVNKLESSIQKIIHFFVEVADSVQTFYENLDEKVKLAIKVMLFLVSPVITTTIIIVRNFDLIRETINNALDSLRANGFVNQLYIIKAAVLELFNTIRKTVRNAFEGLEGVGSQLESIILRASNNISNILALAIGAGLLAAIAGASAVFISLGLIVFSAISSGLDNGIGALETSLGELAKTAGAYVGLFIAAILVSLPDAGAIIGQFLQGVLVGIVQAIPFIGTQLGAVVNYVLDKFRGLFTAVGTIFVAGWLLKAFGVGKGGIALLVKAYSLIVVLTTKFFGTQAAVAASGGASLVATNKLTWGTMLLTTRTASAGMLASVTASFAAMNARIVAAFVIAKATVIGAFAAMSAAVTSFTIAMSTRFLAFVAVVTGGSLLAGITAIGSAMVAAVLAVNAALLTLLLNPVFLTIAALTTAVVAGGALGVHLFGEGDTFSKKLDSAASGLNDIITSATGASLDFLVPKSIAAEPGPLQGPLIPGVAIGEEAPDLLANSKDSLKDFFSELKFGFEGVDFGGLLTETVEKAKTPLESLRGIISSFGVDISDESFLGIRTSVAAQVTTLAEKVSKLRTKIAETVGITAEQEANILTQINEATKSSKSLLEVSAANTDTLREAGYSLKEIRQLSDEQLANLLAQLSANKKIVAERVDVAKQLKALQAAGFTGDFGDLEALPEALSDKLKTLSDSISAISGQNLITAEEQLRLEAYRDELVAINDQILYAESLSETFREGFASAFKDVITGAESVGDAILGLLTKVGDQILEKGISNFTDSLLGEKGEGGFGDQVGAAGASITGLFGKKEGEGAIGAGPNGTDALPLSVKVVQGAAGGALGDAISPFSSDDALKPEDAATPITDKIDPLAGLGDSAGEDPAEAAKETTLSLGGLTTMVDQATGGVLSFGSNILSSIASIFGFSTSAITGAAATSTGASAAVSFTGALTAAIVALGVFNASLATGAALSIIPGFATGGPVKGPGTGTSDDILASLSNGEYVINARSTRKNRKLLEAINNGADISKFADGGMVGVPKDMSGPLSKGAIDNRNQQKTEQVFNINVTGDISRQTRAEIQAMIPDITRGVNSENMEQGTR